MTAAEVFKSLPLVVKVTCVVVPLAVIAMIVAWYKPEPKVPQEGFNTAPPIVGTAVSKKTAKVATGTVKVIPKDVIKDAVEPLPEEVEKDNIEVLDTAEVPPSENGSKVLSLIDTNTGETKLVVKENKQSLFGFEDKKRIGVGYGYSSEGTTARVNGEWTFLRVGSFHLGVLAEIAATTAKAPEAKALGIVDYRW